MRVRSLLRRALGSDLPREVAVLAAVAFFVAAGFGIVAPSIPVFARSFGVSRAFAAAVVSVFALTRLTCALGVGRLVDRIGSRLVLGTGIVIVAGSSALAGTAGDYAQLLVLRGIGGIGSAMFSVSASSLLLGVTSSEQRGRAMGTFSGGFLLGGIAGPVLGGFITSWSLRAPFFIYAGTLAVAGSVGFALLPRHRRIDRAAAESVLRPMRLLDALRLPAFRAAAAANLADSWGAVGVRAAIVPLFVVEALHQRAIWTGIGFSVFTVANIATLLLAGHLADRRGRRPLMIIGCTVSATGAALLALPPSLVGFVAAMVVFGLGSGLLDVAPGAMMGDVARGQSGSVVAGYQMAGDIGSLAGPLIAGVLADSTGYPLAFVTTSGVLLVATAMSVRAPETLRRADVAPLTTAA